MIKLYVGLAGMAGALTRYAISAASMPLIGEASFPAATFAANMTGCLAIGWLSAGGAAWLRLPDKLKTAVISGFVGSYTTFSTFSVEAIHLLQNGQAGIAFVYSALSLLAGYGFAMIGVKIGRRCQGGERAV